MERRLGGPSTRPTWGLGAAAVAPEPLQLGAGERGLERWDGMGGALAHAPFSGSRLRPAAGFPAGGGGRGGEEAGARGGRSGGGGQAPPSPGHRRLCSPRAPGRRCCPPRGCGGAQRAVRSRSPGPCQVAGPLAASMGRGRGAEGGGAGGAGGGRAGGGGGRAPVLPGGGGGGGSGGSGGGGCAPAPARSSRRQPRPRCALLCGGWLSSSRSGGGWGGTAETHNRAGLGWKRSRVPAGGCEARGPGGGAL